MKFALLLLVWVSVSIVCFSSIGLDACESIGECLDLLELDFEFTDNFLFFLGFSLDFKFCNICSFVCISNCSSVSNKLSHSLHPKDLTISFISTFSSD